MYSAIQKIIITDTCYIIHHRSSHLKCLHFMQCLNTSQTQIFCSLQDLRFWRSSQKQSPAKQGWSESVGCNTRPLQFYRSHKHYKQSIHSHHWSPALLLHMMKILNRKMRFSTPTRHTAFPKWFLYEIFSFKLNHDLLLIFKIWLNFNFVNSNFLLI